MTAPLLHPAILPDCPACAGRGYAVRIEGERAVAAACRCTEARHGFGPPDEVGRLPWVHACSACGDTGLVNEDGKPPRNHLDRGVRKVRCSCQRLGLRVARFNEARIPGRHADNTFRSFKPLAEVAPALVRAKAWSRDWTRSAENRGLVLYGSVGRGKTHLIVAMLRALVFEHGATVRFIEFSHLIAACKASFDDPSAESMGALMDGLVRADVLAIDEIGKGRKTEFEESVIDELISRRYNTGKGAILATTNFGFGEPTGKPAGNLALGEVAPLSDRIGDRAYSRLRELCDWHEVKGNDWRKSRVPEETKGGDDAGV